MQTWSHNLIWITQLGWNSWRLPPFRSKAKQEKGFGCRHQLWCYFAAFSFQLKGKGGEWTHLTWICFVLPFRFLRHLLESIFLLPTVTEISVLHRVVSNSRIIYRKLISSAKGIRVTWLALWIVIHIHLGSCPWKLFGKGRNMWIYEKKYVADDWMYHLSIAVYHRLTSVNTVVET